MRGNSIIVATPHFKLTCTGPSNEGYLHHLSEGSVTGLRDSDHLNEFHLSSLLNVISYNIILILYPASQSLSWHIINEIAMTDQIINLIEAWFKALCGREPEWQTAKGIIPRSRSCQMKIYRR